MSWLNLQFKFAPFKPLKPPLQSALTILQTVEAILEALLALIKAFLLDFLNPIKALIALLLAALRAIINQIKSSGFAILLVHPDFSRGDFGAVLQSVSGGYRTFETKVVSKFFDLSDTFRPQYPPGSSVAMLVLYIGAESPGDLMSLIMALLNLIRHPLALTGLPAPVELTVKPVFKSSAGLVQAVQAFEDLFGDNDKKLVLEWRMPSSPAVATGPTFVNHLVAFYQAFKFPNFVVERCDHANGDEVLIPMKSQTFGKPLLHILDKYNFPQPDSKTELKEFNGNAYRHFPKKFPIKSEGGLLEGQLTGTYRYLDDDPDLVAGKNYWYRVRAYFGKPDAYLNAKTADDVANSKELVKMEGNIARINYGKDVTMGLPSAVVRGFCPRPKGGISDFDVYHHTYDAIKAGLLLNFDFPAPTGDDSPDVVDQKTGWGSLAQLSGTVSPMKAAYKTSDTIKDKVFFLWAARKLANQVASSAYPKPDLLDLLASKWNQGCAETVNNVLNAPFTWSFVGLKSGITPEAQKKIGDYLALESGYTEGSKELKGPCPTRTFYFNQSPSQITVEQRKALADFLRLAVAASSAGATYLQWYSVTVGDIFPALVPFLFDFEQFILALLKALDSVLKEIEAIIEAIITKIQQLEAILQAILDLIDLLDISISLSVLGVTSTNGSAADLASALMASDNKPGSSPFGLHSGMVMTFGGPGDGFVAAFKALRFILGI